MEKTLVVMAAGMGSRFGGLKQIEPVGPNGEFIIDYSAFDAKKAGFQKIVFVIKKELENTFKETIGKRLEGKIKVDYAFQELGDIPKDKEYLLDERTKPWGTVQAVLCARNVVSGDFAVINADDFYGSDSFKKASDFLDNENDSNTYACISYPYDVTASKFGSVKRGVCYMDGDNIIKLIESKITTQDGYALCEPLAGGDNFKIELNHPVSMNMFAFKHGFFDYLDEYFKDYFKQSDEDILKGEALLPELVKDKILAHEITLKNVVSNGMWMGMTYREELEGIKNNILKLIEDGEYPNKLWD